MKVLVLGGDGMLGHELFRELRSRHEARVTLRQPLSAYAAKGLFDGANAFAGVDARSPGRVEAVLEDCLAWLTRTDI